MEDTINKNIFYCFFNMEFVIINILIKIRFKFINLTLSYLKKFE